MKTIKKTRPRPTNKQIHQQKHKHKKPHKQYLYN